MQSVAFITMGKCIQGDPTSLRYTILNNTTKSRKIHEILLGEVQWRFCTTLSQVRPMTPQIRKTVNQNNTCLDTL